MKAVVLAGGKGTRLEPYTTILPKPLMPVGDMPILEILLRQMKRAGIDEVVLTVGYLAEFLHLFFRNGERLGIKIRYSHEEMPLGTAGPLALIDDLDETFLVTNGDVLTTLDIQNLVDFHREHQPVATIAMHRRKVDVDFGVVQLNGGHVVNGYVEKPTYEFMVSMGIYVFEPLVVNFITKNQYFDFPELIKMLIAEGEEVIGFPFEGYWQDLGRPDDYRQAVKDFSERKAEFLLMDESE